MATPGEGYATGKGKDKNNSGYNPYGRTGGVDSSGNVKVWNGPTPVPTVVEVPNNNTGSGGSSGGGGGSAYNSVSSSDRAIQDALAEMRSYYERQQAELARREAERKALLQQQYNTARNQARNARDESLRQTYLAYMRGTKNNKQLGAVTGGGGELETLKNKSQLNYENNRGNILAEYDKAEADLLAQLNAEQMANADTFADRMSTIGDNFYSQLQNYTSAYKAAANNAANGANGPSGSAVKTQTTTKKIKVGDDEYSLAEWIQSQVNSGKTLAQAQNLAKYYGLID